MTKFESTSNLSNTCFQLEARIRELEQALHRYSEHRMTCTYEYQQCDCGLDAVLATIHATDKAVKP